MHAADVLVADVLAADTQNLNTRPITIKLQTNHLKVVVLAADQGTSKLRTSELEDQEIGI